MARETRLIDDIDGTTEDVQTVRIVVGNNTYEIDLGAKNREKLLGPVLKKCRAAGPPVRTVAAIRAWALAEGLKVPARGGIPRAVQDAYDAAHP